MLYTDGRSKPPRLNWGYITYIFEYVIQSWRMGYTQVWAYLYRPNVTDGAKTGSYPLQVELHCRIVRACRTGFLLWWLEFIGNIVRLDTYIYYIMLSLLIWAHRPQWLGDACPPPAVNLTKFMAAARSAKDNEPDPKRYVTKEVLIKSTINVIITMQLVINQMYCWSMDWRLFLCNTCYFHFWISSINRNDHFLPWTE